MNILKKLYNYKYRMREGRKKNNLFKFNTLENKNIYFGNSELSLPNNYKEEKINFHTYWYGEFGRKQAASLKSLICTQNLNNIEITLWLDGENGYDKYEENKYLYPLLPYVKVKKYVPEKEIQGTPFRKSAFLFNMKNNLAFRADGFRMLILYKYGSFYFDLDVLFLNDFTKLLMGNEFCYPWENQSFGNNAVLYLRKGSLLNKYISKKITRLKCTHPWILFDFNDKNLQSLFVYPCSFFDPLWQGDYESAPIKEFKDFFDKPFNQYINLNLEQLKEVFFPYSYAYHWHNNWNSEVQLNSFFYLFEKQLNLTFEEKSINNE